MVDLISHLEKHLGLIAHGWSNDPDGARMPFQIIACKGGPIEGVTAYATLGLHREPLRSTTSDKLIRHELLMLSRDTPSPNLVPNVLHQIGMDAIGTRTAYLRGDVIERRGTLFHEGSLTAVYFTLPVYYPHTLCTHTDRDGTETVIAWCVPITSAEAKYVRERGWNAFEDLLQSEDPDLLDFSRSSFV